MRRLVASPLPVIKRAGADYVTGFNVGEQRNKGKGPIVEPPRTIAGTIGFVVGLKRQYREADHPRIPKGNGRASGRYRKK